MKILFIYPETPSTFWSFRNALKFISKKSSEPPLGLITVAAMLPEKWEKKLIDMNVSSLTDSTIRWADYVFLTGMNIHLDSFQKVVNRCHDLGVKVVAGGPMITTEHENFSHVDIRVLGEVESIITDIVRDLENGTPQSIYKADSFPDISKSPVPLFELLDKKKYANVSIQYSRGCPFNCEFCSISVLNGHKPRTKSTQQLLTELDTLYQNGWRNAVFIVDDNFIGNKRKLKKDILPALKKWSQDRKYPFLYYTEVSINLADDDELIKLMVEAGFDHTFIGIETPHEDSLAECGKAQNQKRDMVEAVQKLMRCGLMVSGGFIVGFDNDPPDIFDRQIAFIQKSGIVPAMVGLLNAPSGTRLHQRLKAENRLLTTMSGDNMDGSINFIPKMNYDKLQSGYKRMIRTIYSPKVYYHRVKTFLREYRVPQVKMSRLTWRDIKALLRSMWILGLIEKGKRYYWRIVLYSLFRHPKKFPLAILYSIYGYHFRKVAETV
ncbi:B12-binding domain-containing radical SAM protein [candidate division KSB1 bacterium]|nr:B12-binding domain-containing radical SAM protein [candidate division KSB1 bacterium]